jgi:hypothetical protein
MAQHLVSLRLGRTPFVYPRGKKLKKKEEDHAAKDPENLWPTFPGVKFFELSRVRCSASQAGRPTRAVQQEAYTIAGHRYRPQRVLLHLRFLDRELSIIPAH